MAIGRISGSVLKSNLTRNGVDLAFETNLLYLDVTNSRVGIGTSEPATALDVNGTITASGISGLTSLAVDGVTITDNTVKSNASNANLELDANGSGKVSISGLLFPTSDGSADQFLKTDGSGTLSFATVSTNSISQLNSNVTVTDTGTGAITVAADGSTIVTFNATTAIDASGVTNAIRLPNGTTAQRPSGAVGEIRYNSSTDTIEGYTSAGGWAQLGATSTTSENTDDTTVGTKTAISTSEVVINQFTTGSFDSAWYLAVTRDEINDEVSTAKYSLVHNDTSAFVATSHITQSNTSNNYITTDADITGGNVRLKATGGSVVNSVSFYRIGLGDNTSASTTGSVTTVINTDVDSATEVIDSWAHGSYRGAKYYISVNNATDTELSNIEALVVHDGTTAYITTYGNVDTGNNSLLNLTAAINGSNVELSATGNEPNLRVTIYRIILTDSEGGSSGDNVNLVSATTVSSTATQIDTFNTQTYTGAFYVAVGYNSGEGAASISEVMLVANDDAYVSTGPHVSTKGTDQLTFTATLSGTTATLKAASTSGSSTTVNAYRVHMLRGTAGAATADTVLVGTTQTITGPKTFTGGVLTDTIKSPASNADITLDPEGTGTVAVLGSQTITNTTTNDSLTITTTEDSSSAGPVISLKRNSSSVANADYLGQIKFQGENDADQEVNYAKISGKILDSADGSEDGIIEFAFKKNGSNNISGRFRSDSLQLLNDTSLRVTGHVELGVLAGDPSGTTNIAHIYAKDESSSAEVFVRDEAGNVTKISPHNEKGEWEYFSRNTKTGKTVRVNMEEMIRDIEKLTGKKYIQDC